MAKQETLLQGYRQLPMPLTFFPKQLCRSLPGLLLHTNVLGACVYSGT
jgi:hypothetical protein